MFGPRFTYHKGKEGDILKLDVEKVKAGRAALRIPITGPELALIVGVNPKTINNIENGKSTKRATAARIAKAIRIPLGDLIKREVKA